MLQISTGKFFEKDDLYINDGKGILYSNYSWRDSIDTCVGKVEPVDNHGNISAYVFCYENRMEKGGILVRTGDHEIIEQFQLIFSFFFQCFTDPDRNAVEMNCRKNKRNMNDEFLPYEFAGRNFEPKINGNEQEVKEFNVFLERLMGLERDKYKQLVQCLEAYNNSLVALNYNFELAYSLLIYCLESISQSFDSYEPTWDDYDQREKLKIDEVLSELEEEQSDAIKSILLENRHLKLQKRFITFITSNIDDSFFVEEAEGINVPLRKSHINQLLKNAYGIRSKYVHSLQSIMKQLKMPSIGSGEVYSWGGNPQITYKGLLRLTHHVIKNFFESQECLESESYNWRDDLPGVVQVELDAKYWIGNTDEFSQEQSIPKLNGFLSQLEMAFIYEQPLTELTDLMKIYQEKIPQSKKKYKLPMISTYILYNLQLKEELRVSGYEKVIESNQSALDDPSIEGLLTYAIVSHELPYDTFQSEDVYLKYDKSKYNPSSIKIPKYFELLIMLNLVNKFHNEGDIDRYNVWLRECILNTPGNIELQKHLISCREENSLIDIGYLVSKKFLLEKEKEEA
ncbi:hypothetical protein [Halobacillus amylolyticus]|uniref:ApeA N-terminal domain-containing protein n=1 Tax=Halobacillus amylolyticus TaxID=2932259 RepID=A0ABY4HGS5_9BACI|nr:hypothetical protein [Halobacillus amylolyticus]UOR12635.1 hypothetical protein MUO15_03690 [Halobacillus amylolyticus]